ncbi:hypothetical protein DMUE_2049 [Dictyocoela muelleri]|nr:hypothetical protein DMUE_2049 [Dictyocoela muelleri]
MNILKRNIELCLISIILFSTDIYTFRIMNVKTGDFLTGINGLKISKTSSDDWITVRMNFGYNKIGVATGHFIEKEQDTLRVNKKGTDFKIVRDYTGYMRILTDKKCWEQDKLVIRLKKCRKTRMQLWQFINDCGNCLAKDNLNPLEEVVL